jgi:hypothetical protein
MYKYYGGKGITVCERWLKYEYFEEDMYNAYLWHVNKYGKKDTTLDRIKGNRNYMPNNCRWATWEEQRKNMSNPAQYILSNGQTLYRVCKESNIDYNYIRIYMLKNNLTPDQALKLYLDNDICGSNNANNCKLYLPCGRLLKHHCIANNYKYKAVYNYIYRHNLSPQEALASYLKSTGRTKYVLPCNNHQKTLSQHCKQNGYVYITIVKYIKKYNLEPDEALARYLKEIKNK